MQKVSLFNFFNHQIFYLSEMNTHFKVSVDSPDEVLPLGLMEALGLVSVLAPTDAVSIFSLNILMFPPPGLYFTFFESMPYFFFASPAA